MEYKRLTKHETDNVVSINGRIFYDEPMASIIDRLAELEDKIDDGILIEKYFIHEDELPSGRVWYNVCELNENYGSIKKQCATRAEADARLAELKGE